MKYITSEFRNLYQSGATLSGWDTGVDLVVCSFFFWTLGISLQKNYVGFLRSLLYQIAEQREDLIATMMGQGSMPDEQTSSSHDPIRIYAWTKERLDDALKRFLFNKPSSISVCLFIDGLDEFVGDEDLLLETLRLLSGTPRVHVCVSSRPEQIYRQGFAQSPKLKLQHLNHPDIAKTVKDRLGTTLAEKFPHSPEVVDEFVTDVISRSEGIFLWTELIIKNIQRGARNSDNLQELRERFDRMPDTIEGLYQHMLDRLERPYLQEAAKYFQLLMAAADFEAFEPYSLRRLTLLDCACAEGMAWSKVLSHDFAYFQSPEFHESCCNLETRILTRCTGLVEISEHQIERLEYIQRRHNRKYSGVNTSQEASSVSCFLREIRFIHKTVIEFLQSHEEFFHDPEWRIQAGHTAVRGVLGVISLTPIMLCKQDTSPGRFQLNRSVTMILLNTLPLIEDLWPPRLNRQITRDIAIQVASQAYDVLGYVNDNLNGSGHSLNDFVRYSEGEKPSWWIPFHDLVGFTAYFGQHDYISTYMAHTDRNSQDVEYVLLCALSGFYSSSRFPPRSTLNLALGLQEYCKIVLDLLKYSRNSDVHMKTAASAISADWDYKWAVFLDCSLQSILLLVGRPGQEINHSISLWKDTLTYFLGHDADANIMIQSRLFLLGTDKFVAGRSHSILFTTTETLLSWIERNLVYCDLEARKEIEDMVKLHGGQRRRTIRSIEIDRDVYHLTQEQSDRLLYAWVLEDGSVPMTGHVNTRCLEGLSSHKKPSSLPSASPDPTTERKLKILLDNIDRFRLTRENILAHGSKLRTRLDFGD